MSKLLPPVSLFAKPAGPITSPHTFIYSGTPGDAAGVLYFAGQGYDSSGTWSNPHPTYVTNQRSTDDTGFPIDLTNRTVENTFTGNFANSWITVDLGSGVALVVSDYTVQIRNVADPRALRNWRMRGSNDAVDNTVVELDLATWDDIDIKVANTDMANTASQHIHYTASESNPLAYRWIQILQDGLNGGSVPDNYLAISEIELYGTLTF